LSFDAWKPGAVQSATVEVPVHIIEAVESSQLSATLKGHEEGIWQVAWSPDGKTLASLSSKKSEVRLWNVADRRQIRTLTCDLGDSYGMAMMPDGKRLVVAHWGGWTGSITFWDVTSGERTGHLQHTPPRGITRLALSGDGTTLACSEGWKEGSKEFKHGVTLWDTNSGKVRDSLPTENLSSLALSPDGKVLAQAVYTLKDSRLDGIEVRRRDLSTGKAMPALANTAIKTMLNYLAFSPDGRTLAGCDYEGNIRLWDTESAKARATLKQEDKRRIAALAFSPDGRTLATAVGDRPGKDREPGLIVLWDVASGRQRLTLTGHTNAVLTVAYSPDGKMLASGGSDRTVRLWDMTALPTQVGASGGR
jgi:WD40 repeat protein